MLIRDTIDRTSRVGSTVAVVSACAAIPACCDRVYVILRCAPCGLVPRGARLEYSKPPQSYHEHESRVFEIIEVPVNYYYESI